LIKFDDIADKIQFLHSFYFRWGLKANDWALLFFLVLLFYSAWRLFYRIPQILPKQKLIDYYLKKLNQDFDSFFELFNKYEKKSNDIRYFESYKEIVFNSKFVAETSNRNTYLFTKLLDKMGNDTFKPFFTHVLNDFESVFYAEIKKNYNSFSVESFNYFLYTTCHDNPKLFIDIGGLKILRDWYIVHLQTERLKGKYSIYNQPPELLIDDYKYALPLYYHISFIELLYNEAIIEHYDFSLLSTRYTNMQTIFSTMIERMIDNIDIESYKKYSSEEYPLGYHYLISKIFSVIGHWLHSFCQDEHYDKESSLVIFIPFCFSLSMESINQDKVCLDFIKKQYRYHLFSEYFSHNMKPELESEINDRCISKIPINQIKDILDYALNDILAISYIDFVNNNSTFPVLKDFEKSKLESLRTFLDKNNLI